LSSCNLRYAHNQLMLLSDAGNSVTVGHPGTPATLRNSQCSVDLSQTTVTVSGNTLTITPTITFKPGFQAGVQIYMYVANVDGSNSGWKRVGWWMVGSMAEAPPSAVSVTPSSGNGVTQQFTFVANSPDGAADLTEVDMLFNTTLARLNSCGMRYTANQLLLLSDDGNSVTSGQPGTAVTLSNSQCSVDLLHTTVTISGNTLTIAPTITFKAGFQAGVQIFMYVADFTGASSGWQRLGWWMVGSTVEAPPSAVSVTPSSGYGATQQFSFVASSPNGAADLTNVEMLFNTALARLNSCGMRYSGNLLLLLSDDGSTVTFGQPGTAVTLSNSQCSVDLSQTTVTVSGNTLTISPTITFKNGFQTGAHIYMYVADFTGANTGWKRMD
jgi:hypothetical protein